MIELDGRASPHMVERKRTDADLAILAEAAEPAGLPIDSGMADFIGMPDLESLRSDSIA